MLSILRSKKVKKWILWGLALIIIPAFIFLGTGNMDKKRIGIFSYVGFIKGRKISIDDFLRARKGLEVQVFLNYFSKKELLEKILKDRLLVNKLTWERIIMLEEARKKGIKINDKEVVAVVISQPLFQTKGVFDEKFYNYVLSQNLHMGPRMFEEELRQSLKIFKLKENILKDVKADDSEILGVYKDENELGKITYARIEKEPLRGDVIIDENMIDQYYQIHRNNLKMPEKINMQVISFSYENLEQKQALFKKVTKIGEELRKGIGEINAIAKQENKQLEETGLFSKESVPQAFGWNATVQEAIFSVPLGDVRVISDDKTEGSIYLIRIKEKQPPRIMSKEEAMPFVRNMIFDEKTEILAKNKAHSLFNTVKNNPISLEAAAPNFGAKVDKTDLISRFDYLEGVGEAYDILNNLFQGKLRNISSPFKTRKGYIVARLDEFKEIDKENFEQKKEEYRDKVIGLKKQKVLKKWLAEISKDAQLVINLNQI